MMHHSLRSSPSSAVIALVATLPPVTQARDTRSLIPARPRLLFANADQ